MIVTVTDEKEIDDCQKNFCAVLEKNLTNKKRCRFGVPGSSGSYDANYNDEMWWHYLFYKGGAQPRHDNCFGLCPLSTHELNEINLEISIPDNGLNRRIQGLFAKDTINKNYLILHRGRFHRRSKDSFLKWYRGKKIEIFDGNRKESLIYIANLSKPQTLIAEITLFLKEVIEYKKAHPLKK